MKALTALRLVKEDGTPNAILARRLNPVEDETPFIAALPTAEGSSVPDDMMGKVDRERTGEPCLFQGSVGTAYNETALRDNGITHILTAAQNIGTRFKGKFEYKVLPLLDSPGQDIFQFFDDASEWIDSALMEASSNRVLVHCFAGKSRASTITCAYLMRK